MVAPIGAIIGLIPGFFLGDGSARSIVTGAAIGFVIGFGMAAFDTAWAVGIIPRAWTEAPFLVVLITRSLSWLVIIVVGIVVPLLTIGQVPVEELTTPEVIVSIVISFLLALIVNFVGQVNRLLGRGVLVSLLVGRYHRPREENRVFLLVDVQGSTGIAEQIGNLEYHRFLKRFVSDVTTAVRRHGGIVHRYIGDEIIFTWQSDKGLEGAACVRAVFAMSDTLDASRNEYETQFGVEPRFWAALHVGRVVSGEIGTLKHEIVFIGDTVNTVARIEAACRTTQRTFLASADVVTATVLPDDVTATSLGPFELKGVGTPVELFAIDRTNDGGGS